MMTIDQVDALRDQLLADGTPKPDVIRQIALDCLDWPYVFGAWGGKCTPTGRKKWYNLNPSHTTIKTKCPSLNSGAACSTCKWGIGVRMFDCRGFTRWLLQQVGLDIVNAKGQVCQTVTNQYNATGNWAKRGTIDQMPDCVCNVFDLNGGHTGMHIGGGQIVHCSTNVKMGSTSEKRWTHFAVHKGLYDEGEIPVDTVKPTLRRGAQGDLVKELQQKLTDLGYPCGEIDGKFGTKTYNALVGFQTEAKLDPDGVCGPKTWAALDSSFPTEPEKKETYRVTIEGVTYEQYRRILDICPLAEVEKE